MPGREKLGYEGILEEIDTGTPRAAVLVASAWVEEILRAVVVTKMVKLTTDEEKRLFSGYGPLASFSSKIQVGYALGLFGRRTRHDLNCLREIRNDFAHSLEKAHLDDPTIEARIRGLNAIRSLENREELTVQQLLTAAVERVGLCLIMKTAPAPPNTALRSILKDLD